MFNKRIRENKTELNFIVENSFVHKYLLTYLPRDVLSLGPNKDKNNNK